QRHEPIPVIGECNSCHCLDSPTHAFRKRLITPLATLALVVRRNRDIYRLFVGADFSISHTVVYLLQIKPTYHPFRIRRMMLKCWSSQVYREPPFYALCGSHFASQGRPGKDGFFIITGKVKSRP